MRSIDLSANGFAEGIATALRDDFGADQSMAKTIASITGAAIGTVRKWLAAEHGPSGEHLMKLMAASDSVWRFVLATTERENDTAEMRERMRRALALLEGRE